MNRHEDRWKKLDLENSFILGSKVKAQMCLEFCDNVINIFADKDSTLVNILA